MTAACNDYLRTHPNSKLVACVNYKDSIRELKQELVEFVPLVLDGRVPKEARAEVIDKFQRPDLEWQLLIRNVHVCSTGIDLDNKHGSFPRLCIVSPFYSTLTIHQLGHRFLRLDTEGSSELRMFYIQQATELPVLRALAKKGGVCTEEQVKAGVLFPCDYPSKSCS